MTTTERKAPELGQDTPQPDGTLHADGYFTWNGGKRPVYLQDRGLPCGFYLAAQPVTPSEPLTRFCPGCGSVGAVPDTYRDCCPDGGHARMVPESLAQRCHDLFKLALDGALQQPQAEEMMRLARNECGDDMVKRGIFVSGWVGAEKAHKIGGGT